MSAVTDSVKNGTLNVHENENLIHWGVSATALPNENSSAAERWPGWPGDCVFRVIIPVHKVGAITGRQGEFVRKLLQETRARIQVLGGPATTPDRLVCVKVRTLISYAEDIIGAGGANITYIRWRSGVSVIVKEGPNPGELILVIKGTFSQVQIAQQLIQEFISKQKDPVSVSGGNARIYSTDNVPVQSPQLNNRQEPLSSSYMGIETGPKVTGPSTSRH